MKIYFIEHKFVSTEWKYILISWKNILISWEKGDRMKIFLLNTKLFWLNENLFSYHMNVYFWNILATIIYCNFIWFFLSKRKQRIVRNGQNSFWVNVHTVYLQFISLIYQIILPLMWNIRGGDWQTFKETSTLA